MMRHPTPLTLRFLRRGCSLIGILVSMTIMVILFAITMTMITGNGPGKPGVKQKAEQNIKAINLYGMYQGIYGWSLNHGDQYPSTKTVNEMEGDTTHDVFNVWLEAGAIAGQQLISPNEFETGYDVGYAGNFGADNTSFALEDYDADDWLRYKNWNLQADGSHVLISDRWVDIDGFEYHSINDTFWYVLFNDGHGENITSGALRNDDSLFDPDEQFGADDTLMVHD